MEDQRCPYCSAPTKRSQGWGGLASYICEYCGNVVTPTPKTKTEKVFAFMSKISDALNEVPKDPVERAKYEKHIAEIREKQLQVHEEYVKKELEKIKRKNR